MAYDSMKGRKSILGFTLIELLVTMGLMALLATVAIGGYYSAVRGMTERGVKQDVISFIRLAQQRALVDQVPTAVFFMNRKLAEEDLDTGEAERIVGIAVAVRTVGRVGYVKGDLIADEYGDLDKTFPTNGANTRSSMRLYRMVDASSVEACFSTVRDHVVRCSLDTEELFGANLLGGKSVTLPDSTTFSANALNIWAFQKISGDGNANWRVGDPYGAEIASLQLPHGYVFGNSVPTKVGETTGASAPCFFDPERLGALDYQGSQFEFNGVEIRVRRPGKDSLERVDTISKSDLNDNK